MEPDHPPEPDKGAADASQSVDNYQDVNNLYRHFILLASRADAKSVIQVLADAESLHAYVAFRRIDPAFVFSLAPDDLQDLLRQAGIEESCVDAMGLELLLELANAGREPPGPFPVARGRPAAAGKDGYIEFHVRPATSEARYDTAHDGTIDYRELNLIENCFPGQLIATLHPPGEGRPGRDIHGRPIRPPPGKEATLTSGPGTLASPDGREFSAAAAGRVLVESDHILVSQEYEIPADVDYRVGNIDFAGRVKVGGAVLDGFRVAGRLGVEVTGPCGACRIESDGNVTLNGGVKGRGAAQVICGGNLYARYLDECLVEARGDVNVGREVMGSTVRTTGRLLVSRGAVIGGEATALMGATVGSAGSPMGVSTRISVGVDWTDEATIARREDALAADAELVKAAGVLLEPFLADAAAIARLAPEDKNTIIDLISELEKLRDEMAGTVKELEVLRDRKRPGGNPVLNYRDRLHPGTIVLFQGHPCPIEETLSGPKSLSREPDGAVRGGRLIDLPERPRPAPPAAPPPDA